MTAPRPYPLDALPRLTRREASTRSALARRLAPPVPDALTAAGWAALLGAPLAARAGVPSQRSLADALAAHAHTSLCAVLARPDDGVAVLACDRPFALALALRALGDRDEAAPHAPVELLAPAHEGALTALLSHVLTRAFAPSPPPTVRAVTEDAALALEALGAVDALLAWPFEVTLGALAGRATILVDARAILRAPSPPRPWPRRALDLTVRTALIAGRARWTAADLAALTRGEVLSLDALRADGHTLAGAVTLRVASHLACEARLRDARTVEIRSTPAPEAPMDDPEARLASLPIELTVEIAQGSARVGDLAAWRAGEVLTFDAPIGSTVTVRANGRAVARGDLVDVDGSVGVRVTELL